MRRTFITGASSDILSIAAHKNGHAPDSRRGIALEGTGTLRS